MSGEKMRGKIAFFPFNDSPSSYFIIMVPSSPNIKIKIPKLLAKTVKKRFHGYEKIGKINCDNDHHKPKRTKLGKFLTLRKVRSMFTNVFGSNAALDVGEHGNSKKGSFFGKNVIKKVGFGFSRGRASDGKSIVEGAEIGGGCKDSVHVATSVASGGEVVIRKREKERKLVRFSKGIMQNQQSSKMVGSLRKIGSKRVSLRWLELRHTDVAGEKDSLELCKKRILMGSKCKPLTVSGALHYDKNGVLLPEAIP